MSLKNLSFLFALYGLLLLAAGMFCLWASAIFSAGLLSLAGFGALTFAHFFNRKHYWGFSGFLFLLFTLSAVFGWYVISYFREKTLAFSPEKVTKTETWLLLFGGLFVMTLIFLLIGTRSAAKARRELNN